MSLDEIKRRDWLATYPTREAALALVAWITADDWESYRELDRRLPGIGIGWTDSFSIAANRCFEVYGYPDLEPTAVARRMVEVDEIAHQRRLALKAIAPRAGVAGGSDGLSRPSTPAALSARPKAPQAMTYGFTPRR